MLGSYAPHDYSAVSAALDLRGDKRVIDAGGGHGALARLLAGALRRLSVSYSTAGSGGAGFRFDAVGRLSALPSVLVGIAF